jgi:ribulose-phosphate 3-epimerase
MVTIIPAILATNVSEFSGQLDKLKSTPELEGGWVHIDLMDGVLVENKSLSVEELEKIEIPFKKEVHLMVEHPIQMIDQVTAQKYDRIIIHLESESKSDTADPMQNQIISNLNYIEDHGLHTNNLGVESGLAINPDTDLDDLKLYLNEVNVVQIMGVVPGKQGQRFIEKTVDRVKELVRIRQELGLSFQISVDGGVNDTNAGKLMSAGADILVIGSFLQKGDIDENLEKIWEVTR